MENKRSVLGFIGFSITLILGFLLVATHSLAPASSQESIKPEAAVTLRAHHPAVGSWFGKAEETCIGPPGTNCAGLGIPAISLFMTPSFYADGNFLGNDSLAVGGPPFGPHTTAHGEWAPTGNRGVEADIVFMLPAPVAASVSAVHIKYAATVNPADTMYGYVNIYVAFPPLALSWESLAKGQFPNLPSTVTDLVTPPNTVYQDQSECTTSGCPLVFKFKVLRVTT